MFNEFKEQLVVYLWLIFHFKPFLVTEKLLNEQFQVDFSIELQLPACFPAVISYSVLVAFRKMCKYAGEQRFERQKNKLRKVKVAFNRYPKFGPGFWCNACWDFESRPIVYTVKPIICVL